MATIIIRNSTGSGAIPSSLQQGELAINTKDGKLFYGSGSGNIVKEFTGSGGGGTSFPYTGSATITGSLIITGSTTSTLGFTGSLLGTASYAANGGVTQLLAGPNISLSPTNGLGQVTVSATLSGSTIFNTSTGSYGSFYDTTTQTNPVGNVPRSMSFNSTDITNSVSISGSTNPFNTYIKTTNAGVYDIQFSAQLDKTDFGTDKVVIWLRKNGSDLTDTATSVTLQGNNARNVAAWNWFVSSAAGDYYQVIWYSPDTNVRLFAEVAGGGHPGVPSVILTVNRVDQFLSNTGSFTGSFTGRLTGTASYATQALSASFAPQIPTFPFTGSAIISGSLVITGSFEVGVPGTNNPRITSTGTLNRGDIISVDWINRNLQDTSTTSSVDWDNRTLYDTTGVSSVDWNNRQLLTPGGNEALSYSDDTLTNSGTYHQQNTRNSVEGESLSSALLNHSGQAIRTSITGSAIDGNIVYLDTDGIWKTVNQTTVTSTKMLGIKLNTTFVLLEGDAVLEASSMIKTPAYGAPLYIWEGGTVLSSDIPTSGYVRVLGHCYYQNTSTTDNWIVKFRPSNDWYEI